jgi:hypothetical protein
MPGRLTGFVDRRARQSWRYWRPQPINNWPIYWPLRKALRRARSLALPIIGLSCFVLAGFVVSRWLGFVVAGAAAFVLEWRADADKPPGG